ncbi:MAG: hypothetical protein V1838_00670 [Patescibacteria group bacterium]
MMAENRIETMLAKADEATSFKEFLSAIAPIFDLLILQTKSSISLLFL